MESAIYVVATPIGNLADITMRGIDVLKNVDFVAAEDTRHTRRLLDYYGISAKLISYHEHNEDEKSNELIALVSSGKSIALVSDAGTPLISDPGHVLVSRARLTGIKVIPVPGASAAISALSVSGLPCGRFIFEGFLPVKQKAKKDYLESFRNEKRSVVFYESPHRIIDTLELLAELFPGRQICVARELTKRFETITTAATEFIFAFSKEDGDQQKGEFVIVLAGAIDVKGEDDLARERLLVKLLEHLPPKKAVQIVVDEFGGDKKELYAWSIVHKNERS